MQQSICIDGAPCAVKVARTVRSGGKSALTAELKDLVKAADYLSLWKVKARSAPFHATPDGMAFLISKRSESPVLHLPGP